MLFQSGIILCIISYLVPVSEAVCTTPNGDNGTCISIYDCAILLGVVKTKESLQLQFLRDSKCGYEKNPLVCCGRYDNYQVTTRILTSNAENRNLLPSKSQCGRQSTDRIYGGEATAIDEFPWMVLLQYRLKFNGTLAFACGGSLISSRYILTAAHCVTGRIVTEVGPLVNIRFGEWDTTTGQDCVSLFGFEICNDPPVDIAVEEVIPHSGYNGTTSSHDDIALVRLRNEIQFSNFIRPICLPQNERSKDGDYLFVAGWGYTEKMKRSSKKLKIKVPIVSNQACGKTFRPNHVVIGSKQLCAGGENGKDSCRGDSGGPLMTTYKNDTSQWYAEGVVSFGAECGSEGWPGVYSRVTEYVDWIKDNMRA